MLSNTKLESSLIHISRRREIAKKTTVWISCLESFEKKEKKKNNVPTSNKFKLLVQAFLKFFSAEVSNWKLHTTLHHHGFGGSLPSWFDFHLHNCFQRETALGLSPKALPVIRSTPRLDFRPFAVSFIRELATWRCKIKPGRRLCRWH